MLKRVLVAVVGVPVVVAFIYLAGLPFALLITLITAVASWELLHAMAKLPLRLYIYTLVAAAAIPFGFYFGPAVGVKVLGFTALLMMTVVFAEAILSYGREGAIPSVGVFQCLFAGVIMPAMMASLCVLNSYGIAGGARAYVILAIGLAFITDAGAYFAGVLLGKHRGITRVSPKKSAEGFVGGLVVGAAFALVMGAILSGAFGYTVNYLYLAIYGVFGALVTEVGDLAFSLIKREYGIKDYGKLLPGHGGMMDRFDSMVFCAPVVMLLSQTIPALIP